MADYSIFEKLQAFFMGVPLEKKIDPAQALQNEAQEIKKALLRAYGNFNEYTNPEMTDYGIYEIKALETKYSYLLQQLKHKESKNPLV